MRKYVLSDTQLRVLLILEKRQDWTGKPDGANFKSLDVLIGYGLVACRRVGVGSFGVWQYKISDAGREWLAVWQEDIDNAAKAPPAELPTKENVSSAYLLAKRLAYLRGRRQWTQADLAHKIGVTRTGVVGIEGQYNSVSLRRLDVIGKAVGVPPYILIANEEVWLAYIEKERL